MQYPVFVRIRDDIVWEDVREKAISNRLNSSNEKPAKLHRANTVLFSTLPILDEMGNKTVSSFAGDSDDKGDEPVDDDISFDEKGNPKPLCAYGAKCYRKNPEHTKNYSHGKKDKKEDKTNTDYKSDTKEIDFDNEATVPLDLGGWTNTNNYKSNNKEEDSSDTEQALITKGEWKQTLKRIAQLEKIIVQFQSNDGLPTKKRKLLLFPPNDD